MSVSLFLKRAAQQQPDKIATIFNGRQQSYSKLEKRVSKFATALCDLGVQKGDRVGMLSLNSDRYLEYFFAIPWMGAWLNPVNIRWAAKEMIYSFNDSETKVLLIDDQFVPMVEEFRAEAKTIEHYIYVGEGEVPEGMISYEAMINQNEGMKDVAADWDDVYGIFYTGGTTGFPKGAMLTHRNMWSTVMILSAEFGSLLSNNSVYMHAAPMFHLADGWFLLTHIANISTHVIIPTFAPGPALQAISEFKVTEVLLVPTMVQLSADHLEQNTFDVSSLRTIVYGASPITEAVLVKAMGLFEHTQFIQAYGATELGPTCILPPEDHSEEARSRGLARACGQPARGIELKLLNGNGEEVPRGEVGEICVRSPATMNKGYWKKPDQTEATIIDNWIHIGDAGRMDENGYLYIVDRVKDMIISGGENIYSSEVEQAVARHSAVSSCAVIGIPSAEWGEGVHAVIVLRPGIEVTQAEIREHCKDWIAAYKCPRSVSFIDELPVSGAGKIQKNLLREPYWRDQERSVG